MTGNLSVGDGILCLATQYQGGGAYPEMDLWAGNNLGLFRSTSAGVWEQVLPYICTNIATYEGYPHMVVVTTYGSRIHLSTDFGASWSDESGNLIGLDMQGAALSPWNGSIYVATGQAAISAPAVWMPVPTRWIWARGFWDSRLSGCVDASGLADN